MALLVLALGWVLLGVGWKAVRAGCASAVEVACSGVATPEKGPHPMSASQPAPSEPTSGLWALLCACAAAAHLAACASAPIRPDMGRVLEQCPPEARATARSLGLRPIMEIRLETTTCASQQQPCPNAINVKSGPMEGKLYLSDDFEPTMKVTGEAKVFPDRVYISFDRVYPTPEGPPMPLCGVALNDDTDRFGVTAHAALPPTTGLEIDPARVDKSPNATVLRWPVVYTYIQGPEGTFHPRR